MVFWECNPVTSLKLIYYFHQAWGVWSMCMCVLVSEEPRYLGSPWCCNYRWIWTIYMGAGNPTQVPEITACALNYCAIFSPCHLLLYVSVCSALLLVANVLLANFLIKPHHRYMYVCIGKEVIHRTGYYPGGFSHPLRILEYMPGIVVFYNEKRESRWWRSAQVLWKWSFGEQRAYHGY